MAKVIANQSFRIAGQKDLVRVGQVFNSTDKVVKGREHLFDEIDAVESKNAPKVRKAKSSDEE